MEIQPAKAGENGERNNNEEKFSQENTMWSKSLVRFEIYIRAEVHSDWLPIARSGLKSPRSYRFHRSSIKIRGQALVDLNVACLAV
jgi:hypothetical protein